MTAQGISTVGPRGVRFRSRLEARWAALFTLLRWRWAYEPDLELNGWIPDFAILQDGGLLVEVKPAIVLSDFERHKARIESSGTTKPVWLVGASPDVALLWDDGTWYPSKMFASSRVAKLWVHAGNALQWRRM